jgi:hypothetical protein
LSDNDKIALAVEQTVLFSHSAENECCRLENMYKRS